MQQRNQRGNRTQIAGSKSVPVINGEGLPSQLSLAAIRQSGKSTVCHGTTFDGKTVNSGAFHKSGQSIVIAPNSNFDVGLSMPQADFQVLARKYLEGEGCTITAPVATKS